MTNYVAEPHPAPSSDGRRHVRGEADVAALLAECAAEEWDGARTRMLGEDLWIFGWDVVRGLISSRAIGAIPTGIPPASLSDGYWEILRTSSEEREAVTLDVLAKAVPDFMATLREGAYAPDKSGVTTFFIGRCGLAFRDVAEKWVRETSRHMHELGSFQWDDVWQEVESTRTWATLWEDDTITAHLMVRSAVAAVMSELNPQERIILSMVLQGEPRQKIADELRISLKAVEGRLTRLRRAIRPRILKYLAVDGEEGPR